VFEYDLISHINCHLVTIATGRALFDAKHIINKYDLDFPIIASNGAQIDVGNQVIFEHFMDSDVIQPMYCKVLFQAAEFLDLIRQFCQINRADNRFLLYLTRSILEYY
jgi:hydroxymethylpyrimidine pyrophosphatase-like HAD family hydrolase